MRQSGFQQQFNVGELGPDLWSRSDLAQHSRGCLLGWNMIGRVAGPSGRRRGTWLAGLPKAADKPCVLAPFRRSSADALVLEFGDLYMRVWTVNGAPVMSGGAPYEKVSPYAQSQLSGIRFKQIGDVVYLTHRDNLRMYTLTRNGTTDWTFTPTLMIDGPWLPENGDETHLLSVSGGTLTSTKPMFEAGHAGATFRLRPTDGNPGLLSWEPGEENVALGAQRLSNGRVYQHSGGENKTGNTPPLQESGAVSDGAAIWTCLNDGAGVVRIIAVTSPTTATVNLINTMPDGVESGTRFWSECVYSDARGWPSAPAAVREERLALAASRRDPDAIDFTRTAGFTPGGLDFKPGLGTGRVVDDDAVRRFVGEERNRLVWVAGATFLMAATTEGEFLVSGATVDDPISPSGCVARPISDYGAADVMPVLAQRMLAYVAAGGETLRFVGLAPDQSLSEGDLSVGAEHICGRGLAELAWMKQPDNLLWVRLADGGQASMTWHLEQGVRGWNRHGLAAMKPPTVEQPLGGGFALESSCVVPGVNGRPRLFMAVHRVKDGADQRLILRMADPEDRLFLDAAETYVGAATGAVVGLDHLKGEAVTMMAATEADATTTPGRGWGEYRDRAVDAAGAAALPETVTATRIQAGLPYLSRWEGLPPELAGPGSSAGQKVRYTHALLVIEAATAEVGTIDAERESGTDRLLNREPGDVAGPALRRTTWKAALLGGAAHEKRLFVQTTSGFDMMLCSIRAVADVS